MTYYKRAIGLILFLILFSQFCIAGMPQVIVDSQLTRVMLSNEYTYYGIDFSKFKLINGEKMAQGESIKNTFCPAWLEKFDENNSQMFLKSRFYVETLNDERYPFQAEQYLKNSHTTIVSLYSIKWSIDTLELIVKDYQLTRKSGIGVSYIISEFNKNNELVSGYVTFFDIETRDLLYVFKTHGYGRGTGMTNHWYKGLKYGWNDYFLQGFQSDKSKVIQAEKNKME